MFCNSVAADRIGMPASRLLGAAAACVILLSFAAEHRKPYWGGCIQAAIALCQHNLLILAIVIFLVKFLSKSASKSSFCRYGVEIRFWSCSFRRRCAQFYGVCNSVPADCNVVAASRLLGAAAACVILLSFAAEHRKSYWGGCIQAAIALCQHNLLILAIVIFLVKFLSKSASKSSFCRYGVEIRFWSCSFRRRCAQFYGVCNSVSADCNVVAASRLFGAAAACVILLSFAAEDCKSHWNGCIQVALVICQHIF